MIVEAHPGYVPSLINNLHLDGAEACATPSAVKPLVNDGNDDNEIDDVRKAQYVSCVMRALCLSADRHDIAYTVKELSRACSRPTEEHWAQLQPTSCQLSCWKATFGDSFALPGQS